MGESKQALRRRMRKSLEGLHLHLQVVYAGVVVTTAALRDQDVDHDREIALVLT
jgi:hypothetical protein